MKACRNIKPSPKLRKRSARSIPNRSLKYENIHEVYLYDKDVFLYRTLYGLSFDRKIKRRLTNSVNYENIHFISILNKYK